MKRKTFGLLLVSCLLVLLNITVAGAAELRFLSAGYPAVLLNYMIEKVAPEFERLYGVKVSIESASWDNRMDKIMVSLAGGMPYDIISTGFYSVYEEGSQGLLEPLDKYLADWELTKRFPQPIWEALKWKGSIYAVPQNQDLRTIAYNTRLFGEAGLDPNKPPMSWDEMIQAARRLTKLEGDRLGVRGFARSSSVGGRAHELFWFMRMAGVPEVDPITLTSNLDKPVAETALIALSELADASRYDLAELPGGFAQGRIAMQRQHPGMFVTALNQNSDIANDYALFAPRQYPTSQPVAHGFINGLGILASSKNKDLAWKFIALLYRDDILLEAQVLSGFMAGRLDMVTRMTQAIHPKISLFYPMFEYLQASIVPPPRNTSQQMLGNLIQQVYNKQMSPQAALLNAHQAWAGLLEEWRATIK
ncbi:MAG: ABC transporter substrate-binding protein [Limnochordia bacterium]|jgi:ABC-type glycerol-3-phosphate transport system substrate-binding protein